MPTCRCPHCGSVFEASSSSFAKDFECPTCARSFVLDIDHIARFEFPELLAIRVVESDGRDWQGPALPVLVRRGCRLPPLRSDGNGCVSVSREMYERATQEWVATDLMGAKGDYSCERFIEVQVPTISEGIAIASQRGKSGWPISPLEQSLYGDRESLLQAYALPLEADVGSAQTTIDLATSAPTFHVTISVNRAKQG